MSHFSCQQLVYVLSQDLLPFSKVAKCSIPFPRNKIASQPISSSME
jgi:hypothetical protein